ncbi:MAG: pyridoxamine 5'-phosphate oxidase family protein [Thermoplasmata archaeon]|nr:pyridoxamine 5'-phosphate oxidase family protein [Thermoplasmata archaeon]
MRSMRRREKEVTDRDEMVRVLRETRYVTVAMCGDDGPYLVTLSHCYDPDRNAIYFHCAHEGRKIDILRRDGRVWGQALIDLGYADGKCDHLYQTTQFRGKVKFVEEPEEKRYALGMMIRKNEKDPVLVESEQVTDESVRNVNIGRIDIDLMTGKRSDRVVVSV